MSEPPREWPNTDPAYSGQYWSPPYYPPPTEQIPPYWQPGMGYPPGAPPPPPPPPPKSPRWLWIAAGAAVLLVAGLVIALVVVSNSTRESTVVAPPTPPTSSATAPRPTLPPLPFPMPTASDEPGLPPGPPTGPPAAPETVVYSVTGEGRAINITYVDTDGVMQTEFNVALPWSKEVTLAAPAKNSASVAVVNVGRDVTCSVTVNGAQVRQRSGRGLTICSGVG